MAITGQSQQQQPPATPPLPPSSEQQTQQQQPPSNDFPATTTTASTTVVCDYEQTREQRIKENRERLQKLGIVDLSLQLKSMGSTRRGTPRTTPSDRRTPLKSPALGPTPPTRRSSRLQNAPPVVYVEPKEEKVRKNRDIVLEEGSKPEVYTEEHEKLLGNTEMPWTFFVDGYRPDGTRIYDPVAGKTCHQCRQKTLGQRTHCSQCRLVQGQFCGDCLYMRYGEHVVEANQNPGWICPPCRGICNCSLCRNRKGWAPTGALYNRVSNLGYKSVAHFLIATKRAPVNADNVSVNQQSAKRALPFEGMEGSDDKLTDENTEISQPSEQNGTTITDHNLNPECAENLSMSKEDNVDADVPVRNSAVSEDDSVSEMKNPKSVGRPRKRPVIPDADANEESVRNSEMLKEEPVPAKTPGKVGRPRKKPKNENDDAGQEPGIEESVRNGVMETDQPVPAKKTPGKVGRPRKKPENENGYAGQESVIDESVRNDEMVIDEPIPTKKTPGKVGRPRKKPENENGDAGQVSVIEESVRSDEKVTDEPVSAKKIPDKVGRPRKRPENENCDAGRVSVIEESVRSDEKVTDEPISPKKTLGKVGRPRKRPENENGIAGQKSVIEESARNSEMETDEPVPAKKTPGKVGRPRKRPENENGNAGQKSIIEESARNSEMETDEPVPAKKTPGKVGRPRKKPKNETGDVGQESVMEDGTAIDSVSEMKSPNTPSSNVDSIARRLRSSDRTVVSVC